MIKIELSKAPEREYPELPALYVNKDTNVIIFFNKENCGTCLVGGDSYHTPGDYYKGLTSYHLGDWRAYTGTIEISNE